MASTIGDAIKFNGEVSFGSSATISSFPAASINENAFTSTTAVPRSKLAQDANTVFGVPFTALRVWDNYAALLPAAAATDDLGLVIGTFGTNAPKVQAGDLKAAGATNRRAGCHLILPAEYDDAETATIRIRAAMETTVSDTTCTVDVEAFLLDGDGSLDGSPTDLVTTAATSMNSVTVANYDFALTSTSLVSGSHLDVRITIACNDAATGTAVTPSIYAVSLLADVRG